MKVKCAAIRTKEGVVFIGKSHAAIFQMRSKGFFDKGTQGFVTDEGEFVDRYTAAEIAFAAGQTSKLESPLFSEDLTGDWFWKRKDETKNKKA